MPLVVHSSLYFRQLLERPCLPGSAAVSWPLQPSLNDVLKIYFFRNRVVRKIWSSTNCWAKVVDRCDDDGDDGDGDNDHDEDNGDNKDDGDNKEDGDNKDDGVNKDNSYYYYYDDDDDGNKDDDDDDDNNNYDDGDNGDNSASTPTTKKMIKLFFLSLSLKVFVSLVFDANSSRSIPFLKNRPSFATKWPFGLFLWLMPPTKTDRVPFIDSSITTVALDRDL